MCEEKNNFSPFKVTVKHANQIDTSLVEAYYAKRTNEISFELIAAYEGVFNTLLKAYYSKYQSKFFDLKNIDSGRNCDHVRFVTGFINAVRRTEFGLAQNVHLKMTCIINPGYRTLLDLICGITNSRPNDPRFDFNRLNKVLRHLKIFTTHTKSKLVATINKLLPNSSAKDTFSTDDGGKMSYIEYFQKNYKLTLKTPQFPLVELTGKGVGTSKSKKLPLELCYLYEKQFLNNAKYGPEIHKELLFKSTHSPNVYFNHLGVVVDKMANSAPKILADYGLNMTTAPAKFKGRELIKPQILPVQPGRSVKFYDPKPLVYAVFCLDTTVNPNNFKQFCQGLASAIRNIYPRNRLIVEKIIDKNPNPTIIKNIFENIQTNAKDCSLVFFGIPQNGKLGRMHGRIGITNFCFFCSPCLRCSTRANLQCCQALFRSNLWFGLAVFQHQKR